MCIKPTILRYVTWGSGREGDWHEKGGVGGEDRVWVWEARARLVGKGSVADRGRRDREGDYRGPVVVHSLITESWLQKWLASMAHPSIAWCGLTGLTKPLSLVSAWQLWCDDWIKRIEIWFGWCCLAHAYYKKWRINWTRRSIYSARKCAPLIDTNGSKMMIFVVSLQTRSRPNKMVNLWKIDASCTS